MSSNVNETGITNSTSFSPAAVDHIITSIWLSVVLVFGTVGNLLLFAVILRKGRITNVTNLFNLNLAIADLIRIFLFIPVYLLYSAHDEWPPGMGLVGCKTVFTIVQNSLTASILTLMFMSMERHRAVVHPLKKQVSKHRNISQGGDGGKRCVLCSQSSAQTRGKSLELCSLGCRELMQ